MNECLDKSEKLLGEKDPRVPEDVRHRVLELAEVGAIPRTSLALWEPHMQCISG